MDVQKSHFTLWLRNVFALCVVLTACAVNPVPTPATTGTASGDGTQNPTSADATTGMDAAAAADALASDAADGAVPAVTLATLPVPATDAQMDPTIAGGAHVYAFSPTAAQTGKLVVVLPDANRKATEYLALATAVAQQGHHVLVLATPVAATATCNGDEKCLESVRQQLIDGAPLWPGLKLEPGDALLPRLNQVLAWLGTHLPADGWAAFCQDGALVWSNIALAGHGEGASLAAFQAEHQALWRVVLIGGPLDGKGATPAMWLVANAKNPPETWRTLAHTNDPNWSIISAAWVALGVGGSAAAVSIDAGATGVTTARLLTTTMNVPDPHAAIAVDGALPTDAALVSHLRDAWKVLFLPN